MKKVICILLIIVMFICAIPMSAGAESNSAAPNPESYPEFAAADYGALYAHATLGGDNAQAWQRWHKDVKGVNFEDGVRYFFLPSIADEKQVEIYNSYNVSVTIGDVVINPYTSAFVDYVHGEKLTAVRDKGGSSEKTYTFAVYKSDAEASLYVNDTTGSYVDHDGNTQNTDLWSFLIQSKENSVSGAKCTIISKDSVQDTELKKIKGRGNTNWLEDKKPFNITFKEKTTIGDVTSKKFSLVSNAKDSSLIRNSLMYDFANDVGSLYSSEQSFIDFYVNGVYRGSYIACQKIDLGKNSVVSLKDESDTLDSDFNFLVEVDVWNYKLDTYFKSNQGYHVVLKTPDLEDYEESDPSRIAKFNYIKSTYQKLEDALYKGTLEDIEKICDLDSLATQYLLQEFGKNCDGGYTSTFFTYNAKEGKFYAAPIWDCDSCLGAVSCVRDGCSTSTMDHKGWVTKIAEYKDTVNPLGQAFNVEGVSSDGLTFEQLCAEIWYDRFIPMIQVLLGQGTSDGRLKSIDEYVSSIEKSAYNNYVMWNFSWLPAQDNSSIKKEYTADYAGEIEYLKDWVKERADWMSSMLAFSLKDETYKNVYFKTDLDWDRVFFFVWGEDININMEWPGVEAEFVSSDDESGYSIYKASVPAYINNIIFNNGNKGEQTVDIHMSIEHNLYTPTDAFINDVSNILIYNVIGGVYDENEASKTDPTLPSTTAPSTEPDESVPSTAPTQTEPAFTTSAVVTTAPTEENILGDTNLDGKVNIKDATVIQKHLARIITLSDESLMVADTNRDGRVTISDATAIQKKIANLIDW